MVDNDLHGVAILGKESLGIAFLVRARFPGSGEAEIEILQPTRCRPTKHIGGDGALPKCFHVAVAVIVGWSSFSLLLRWYQTLDFLQLWFCISDRVRSTNWPLP